jgi:outer membrane protein TolC
MERQAKMCQHKESEVGELSRRVILAIVCVGLAQIAAPTWADQKPLELTFDSSVKLALEKSPLVRMAEQQVVKAAGSVTTARAGKGPQLEASATHTRMGPIATFTIPFGTQLETIQLGTPKATLGKISLVQPIDIWGVINAAESAAEFNLLSQRFALEAARQKITQGVQSGFLGALRSQALQRVVEEGLQAADEHVRIARAHFEAGTAPHFDVLRAEVQAASFRQNLVVATNAIKLATAALNKIIGLDVSTPLAFKEPPAAEPAVPVLEPALEEAARQRPEILQSLVIEKAAAKGVYLAKAGLKPTFGILADLNINLNAIALGAQSRTWDVSAALSLPLFDSGATRGKVKSARADLQSAKLATEDTKRQVDLEVTQARIGMQDAAERLSTARKDVEQAREALRLANVRYQAGVATAVEVTDAEVALTQSRTNEVNATYDYMQARAQFDRALGRPPVEAK